MLKILLADDHTMVRVGLKQILTDTSKTNIEMSVDEASRSDEALRKALENDYDVVLLDISMPGRGGIDVLKQIRAHKHKLPVLILSMYPEGQYAVRALKAGAAGYLTKESAPDELIEAIKKVSKGMKYVSSSMAEEIAFALESDSTRPIQESLSDREHQVMCLIATGKTPREIATELSLSIKTISTYRARILEKMSMKNSSELIHFAIKNQMVC